MLPKADVAVKEVPPPFGRWCTSGHVAQEEWSKAGSGTGLVRTAFYKVGSVKDPNVSGVYCELCLTVAQTMAAKKKMEIRDGTSK